MPVVDSLQMISLVSIISRKGPAGRGEPLFGVRIWKSHESFLLRCSQCIFNALKDGIICCCKRLTFVDLAWDGASLFA